MLTARQKILNYVFEHQNVTVKELSKVFRVTQANIRHHLSILIKQNSVVIVGTKPSSHKGRPLQIYSTFQQVDLHNLGSLSDALLCTLSSNSISIEGIPNIKLVAWYISSRFNSDATNPTRRLYTAIHSLNYMNYRAHWEAHSENPRIMFGNCPYCSILEDHPELCEMDSFLLENLLGFPVKQINKQKINPKGFPECIFLIDKHST